MDWLERTELLIGKEKLTKLSHAHVMVAGLGGVGSWCAEMLARAGIGKLTIIDGDTVHPSNRNRLSFCTQKMNRTKKPRWEQSRTCRPFSE